IRNGGKDGFVKTTQAFRLLSRIYQLRFGVFALGDVFEYIQRTKHIALLIANDIYVQQCKAAAAIRAFDNNFLVTNRLSSLQHLHHGSLTVGNGRSIYFKQITGSVKTSFRLWHSAPQVYSTPVVTQNDTRRCCTDINSS